MKKYQVDIDGDLIDSETGMLADNSYDEVVPASVAQALYNALRRLTASHQDFMKCAINPDMGTPDIEWSQEIEDQAIEALSLADGEE